MISPNLGVGHPQKDQDHNHQLFHFHGAQEWFLEKRTAQNMHSNQYHHDQCGAGAYRIKDPDDRFYAFLNEIRCPIKPHRAHLLKIRDKTRQVKTEARATGWKQKYGGASRWSTCFFRT